MSPTSHEWLETDGLGGFASGTSTGIRTRRYHALLLTATTPPAGRMVLVNGFEAWIETPAGRFALTSQAYAPDVVHPDGAQRLERFTTGPWPRWRFKCEDGTELEQELFIAHGQSRVFLSWRLVSPAPDVKLFVRPLLSGRDYHALQHENGAFHFDASVRAERVEWRPYEGVPAVVVQSNGRYHHEPLWYRNFLCHEERARGLDCTEDLASPGVFAWDLSAGEAVWILATGDAAERAARHDLAATQWLETARTTERLRRRQFASRLDRAADAYIVAGRQGKTIIAGYPWFTDWGRDTFIALRGLCLATGRLDDARDILLAWAQVVSEGMLPNRFPDQGGQPEFNAVDASLWFIIAAHEFLVAKGNSDGTDARTLRRAIEAILDGCSQGTRYGIRMDDDGLLACGVPGVQLTWMDAKVGDWVVTPRLGKPVEVQALWLNALWIAGHFSKRWLPLLSRGLKTFRRRFWNDAHCCLHDVVDAGHQPGVNDASVRPNQIFAVGGLPLALFDGERARLIVEAVEDRLLTPLGLRSLASGEPGYCPRYEGGVRERDGAYHQGTVWPWLLGPFVEAWVRVRGGTPEACREARARFLPPLLEHLDTAGLDHISEIADADAPHTPRGCPWQAWSVGELLRLDRQVLAEHAPAAPMPKAASTRRPRASRSRRALSHAVH